MWRSLARSLHVLQPETAHSFSMWALRYLPAIYEPSKIGRPCSVLGLNFPNHVGLAAGFDKNGDHINSLAKLGFGFIEVGTITPRPQAGSPKPRLFRLPQVEGIVNRMGFNNLGVEHVARNLAKQGGNFSGILGCNIGCNRDTPRTQAGADYLHCLRRLYGLADYYAINVSSPNTPGLRNMQKPAALHALLKSLVDLREELSKKHMEFAPLLVKVDPDQSPEEIQSMAEVIAESGIDGVIATNTTVKRARKLTSLPCGGQPGGVSGRPLRKLADSALRLWREALPKSIVLIGAGGIMKGQDARAKFAAGADLVQLYTGLIYSGPELVAECARAERSVRPRPG